jgi:hypothetical protein
MNNHVGNDDNRLAIYVVDWFSHWVVPSADAEATMLGLRISRDIMRVTRLFFFLKDLYQTVVDFHQMDDTTTDTQDSVLFSFFPFSCTSLTSYDLRFP